MVFQHLSAIALAIAALSTPAVSQTTQNTAVVNLANTNGAPAHLASGIHYGMPDSAFGQKRKQIPTMFYTGIDLNYARAGGAQAPKGAWVTGLTGYKARFRSAQQDYKTARKVGAKFALLPSDIWGTDLANSNSYWPGDNGNWTNYDNFLDQLIGDLTKYKMTKGLDYDVWNNPDLNGFWPRPQSQWLAMYERTYQKIKANSAFNGVLVVGPSTYGQPTTGSNSWWSTWLNYIVQNNVIPDQYTWHDSPGDPDTDAANLKTLLGSTNAPTRPVNVNEYAANDQQNAAGIAWYISRLERNGFFGLRANWNNECQLHDFMAGLLGKSNATSCTSGKYFGNGQYQVYEWYAKDLTGQRAQTTGSPDGVIDVYTTIGNGTVQTLAGVLDQIGTWYITINGLSSVGLPSSGSLPIQTYGFNDTGHMGKQTKPTDRGVYSHKYSGDSVTFPVFQTKQDADTAWVFEFKTS